MGPRRPMAGLDSRKNNVTRIVGPVSSILNGLTPEVFVAHATPTFLSEPAQNAQKMLLSHAEPRSPMMSNLRTGGVRDTGFHDQGAVVRSEHLEAHIHLGLCKRQFITCMRRLMYVVGTHSTWGRGQTSIMLGTIHSMARTLEI